MARKPRPSEGEATPTDEDILARALVFAEEGLQAAKLQLQRIREEPLTDEPFRLVIDIQFFLIALRRLRRGAEIGEKWVGSHCQAIQEALRAFDQALPNLALFRDVGEHIEEYAVGAGNEKSVRWRQVQETAWDGKTIKWLGLTMNADDAVQAGSDLVGALMDCRNRDILAAKERH
jgi:hypothetical protein